ncbi:ATP synthase subunit a [Bacteroidia bacterium]|nr:ATP synthase subunit a [Bacteroidia bacterium]
MTGLCLFVGTFCTYANEDAAPSENADLNVRELILEHISDDYSWHITTFDGHAIAIPLPVIVRGQDGTWHVFSSARFEHGHASYQGFSISHEEPYKGKIVETVADGMAGQARHDKEKDKNENNDNDNDNALKEVRPLDFSLTKNAVSLLLSSTILIILILSCARWYKKREGKPSEISPKGFVAFMEMVIMSIVDDVIKPCVGKNYKRYTPYLLTVFFFIIFNNLLGLIPIFPGGANVTGNIAITCVLALCTFVITNIFGTKEYWKEIFNPDVPGWLKPIMAPVEFLGILTKPFALMIRLFASILAGHALLLGLTCIVFLTVRLGVGINSGMTVFSVLLSVFSNFVEILVAYIQAYVFTMLSAIYFGLSQVEPHHVKTKN